MAAGTFQANELSDKAGKELPAFFRKIVNRLVSEEGWRYQAPGGGGHFKMIPPDPDKPIVVTGSTPSDHRSPLNWLSDLRRSGARLEAQPRQRRSRTVTPSDEAADMTRLARADISPISTVGTWWHPSMGRLRSTPEPAPAPTPEPVVEQPQPRAPRFTPRPAVSVIDNDAEGTKGYSLGQARSLIRQGYHLNKVVAKTGWGRNYLSDMVDETGFVVPGR